MGFERFAIIPLMKKLDKRTLFLAGCEMMIAGNPICLIRLPDGTVQELGSGEHTLRCGEKNHESDPIES